MYLNYGIHCCLNAITGRAGIPGCVLIRALEPVAGAETMARRRGLPAGSARIASGPGNLTKALAIGLRVNAADLTTGALTIEPRPGPRLRVTAGPRVGITRAVDLPLRFWIADSPSVSKR